jgi:hypothetical protein
MTASIRETDMPDAKELLSILHLQTRFVTSTEEIPGGIVTTTPGEQTEARYAPMEDVLPAKAAMEVSKDKEMAMAVVGMVIKMLDNTISTNKK